MKRWHLFVLSLLAIVAGFVGGVRPTTTNAQAKVVTINMKDFEFDPKEIRINVGDSVVWNNIGGKKHTATADDNSFDTGVVAGGASSAPVVFSKAGTVAYYCQFHGGPGGIDMSATIIVEEASASAPAAPTAAPVSALAPVGQAAFSDKAGRADSIALTFTALPLPEEGKQYAAWLSDGKNRLLVSLLVLKPDGSATTAYADPLGKSLLQQFNSVLVSLQDGATVDPIGPIVFSGQIPPQALIHIRHVITEFPDTPDKIALILGAIKEEGIAADHVELLNKALEAGNIAAAKRHLEHIHNIITGAIGGLDLNGDGKTEIPPPSDGFGIFNYLTVGLQHADLAAKQPDSTDQIKVRANHIRTTLINTSDRLTAIQALTVAGVAETDAGKIRETAKQITDITATVLKGAPDATGAVSPTKGSGGLGTAYGAGLAMATIQIVPGDVSAGAAAQNVPPPAAATATAPAAAPTVVTITMKDFEFVEKTVTIPVGGSVVFLNAGTKKHTASADDNSWTTGVIAAGASSAPIVFDKPGTFAFFCEFHGGPGGTAMAGTIIVQ